MRKNNKGTGGSVYTDPDYKHLKKFNTQLLNEKSKLGKIISSKSIRKSSQNIQHATAQAIATMVVA